jgi:hypothetical protein
VAHLRAVPDPDDDPELAPVVEPVDPAAAVAPDADEVRADGEEPALTAPYEQRSRRYPSTIGGAFYLSILAAAGTALVIAARTDWRLGIQILGGSLIVAALLRLVLANRDAGMLAVRNRFVDAFLLSATGAALIAVVSSISQMPVN